MSVRAYEAIIPLHEYDLRIDGRYPDASLQLRCLRCGLALTAWRKPPGLHVVMQAARDHEASAHPRAAQGSVSHRPRTVSNFQEPGVCAACGRMLDERGECPVHGWTMDPRD